MLNVDMHILDSSESSLLGLADDLYQDDISIFTEAFSPLDLGVLPELPVRQNACVSFDDATGGHLDGPTYVVESIGTAWDDRILYDNVDGPCPSPCFANNEDRYPYIDLSQPGQAPGKLNGFSFNDAPVTNLFDTASIAGVPDLDS